MTVGTPGFVRERLTEARLARGLTKIALSEMVEVSPMAISQYENGPQSPRAEVLDRISAKLGFPRSFFLRPAVPESDDPIFWRSDTAATQVARERCHQRLKWMKQITAYLREFFDLPKPALPTTEPPRDLHEITEDMLERRAQECRDWWGFGEGPLPDLVLEMENSGVVASRINVAADSLDAFSQWPRDYGAPFVLLGKDKASAARSRFDAAHELAHLLIHRHLDRRRVNHKRDRRILEQQAHRFAAALLLPAESFSRELWAPTLDGMLALKERWRVSVAMMIVRCGHLGITGPDETRRLWINYNRRGWKNEEPLDAVLKPEQPRLLRRSFEMLIAEGIRGKEQIVDDLALPRREIEEISGLPLGFLSGQQAEVKALPTLKQNVQPAGDATGQVVSLFGRGKSD